MTLPVLASRFGVLPETTEEAHGLRPGLLRASVGCRNREEQPGQGDVLEFAQISEVVLRRQPGLTGPPTSFSKTAHGDPHASSPRRKRADVGEEVAYVEALGLLQQSERIFSTSFGLTQPRHGDPPAIGLLRHRRVLTEFLALEEVAPGTLQIVALTQDVAHPDVHVGWSPHEGPALLRHKQECVLVSAQGVAEAPLHYADVT